MAEKKEYREFRELLQKAIGTHRTQAEFAASANITPQHLNRLINSPTIGQPSRDTLMKIAGASASYIHMDDLLKACGYEPEGKPIRTNFRGAKQQAVDAIYTAKNIVRAFEKEPGENNVSDTIEEFVENCITNANSSDISYEICNRKSLDNMAAECAVTVNITWMYSDILAAVDIIIAFSETKNGRIVIFETGSSMEILDKYYPELTNLVEETADDNILIQITDRFPPRRPEITEDAEKRLLAAIFGKKDAKRRIMSVEGLGFYLDNITEGAMRRFVAAHKDAFCRKPENVKVYNAYIGSITPKEEAFKEYVSDDPHFEKSGHFGHVIADIISAETGHSIECWDDIQNLYPMFHNRPSVMLAAGLPWEINENDKHLTYTTTNRMLDIYARELRQEVEECYFLLETDQN